MQSWVQVCGAAVGIGIATAVGCGGSVLVDESGAGGMGGAGGAQVSSVDVTTTSVTSVTSVSSVTSVTSVSSVTSVTSVSTGPTAVCDNAGDCNGCVDCAIGDGGPCFVLYDTCITSDECLAYADCAQTCPGDDPQCYQKCGESYPAGAQQYNELVVCAVCDACPIDCDAQSAGCP